MSDCKFFFTVISPLSYNWNTCFKPSFASVYRVSRPLNFPYTKTRHMETFNVADCVNSQLRSLNFFILKE